MIKARNANVFFVIVATLCIFAAIFATCSMLGGCAVADEAKALRQDVKDLKAQATTMPAGKERDVVVKLLTQAEDRLAQVEQYATVAIGLGGVAFGVYNRLKKRISDTHLENVVNSVEAVLPEKDNETKVKLAALQGPKTSAAVNAIKRGR